MEPVTRPTSRTAFESPAEMESRMRRKRAVYYVSIMAVREGFEPYLVAAKMHSLTFLRGKQRDGKNWECQ